MSTHKQMDNNRETRCISAAFKFLLESDCDLAVQPDGPVKRSESDTALLSCHQENVENIKKSSQSTCALRISETDQLVLEEDRPGKGERSDMPCKGEGLAVLCKSENKCVQMPLCGENIDGVDTPGDSSGQAGHCNGYHQESEPSTEKVTSRRCPVESVIVSEDHGVHKSAGTELNGYGKSDKLKTYGIEEELGEVTLRGSSSSIRRKELTDTAIISNVFEFLGRCSSIPTHIQALPEDGVKKCSCAMPTTDTHLNMKNDKEEAAISQFALAGIQKCGSCQRDSESSSETGNGGQSQLQPRKCSKVLDATDGAAAGVQYEGTDESSIEKVSVEQRQSDILVTGPDIPEVRLRRARLSRQESAEDEGSNDSSDDDAGVYAESFRRSNWIRIDDDGKLELPTDSRQSSTNSPLSSLSSDSIDCPDTPTYRQSTDEVFPEFSPSHLLLSHKRSDSVSTTFSEQEFKREYITRRKCLIQRKQSSREYHRLSAKVYDQEKSIVLEKRSCDSDYGLHILDSQPAYITAVDQGSPAEKAGIQVGQIIITINGMNVLTASHDAIINAMNSNPKTVCIEVATSDFLPSRDLQASVMEGYMHKLGGSSLMRLWKKRYFVLRQDSCLYYYKHQEEADPLGAIPLIGYSISRHLDTGKGYCFKAEKYGARTYYFMTESRDEMTEWVIALVDAAARCKKRKESFLSVSSHNVGLPALEVRRPECSGYLYKVGYRHKTWRRRYCILKDACLYYYKSMNSLSALGVAHLHGYKVDGHVSVGKKHAFAVIPPETNMRIFHFSAENDTDRQRWVEAMIRSIQRWIQVDNTC